MNNKCIFSRPQLPPKTQNIPKSTTLLENIISETNAKPMSEYHKSWKTVKTIDTGAQGEVYSIKSCLGTNTTNIEYVAKLIPYTNTNSTRTYRKQWTYKLINRFNVIKCNGLANYCHVYYDKQDYLACVVVMEKLHHTLYNKYYWKETFNRNDISYEDGFVLCRHDLSILRIAMDLATNIKKLHDLDYGHFDIKPENILYNSAESEWQLIDFDLMEEMDPNKEYFVAHSFFGTRGWTAPEIRHDNKPYRVSKKADVWALGLVLLDVVMGGNKAWKLDRNTDYNKLINYLHARHVISGEVSCLLRYILVIDVGQRRSVDEIIMGIRKYINHYWIDVNVDR